ncbi:unnamed protein product, partial [marine sediment metagenome]
LLKYTLGIFLNSSTTFKYILEEKSIFYSLKTVIIFGLLYTAICFIAYSNHIEPITPPLLNIELSKFYLYAAIYCIPMFFLFWIVVAGFIQVLARYFGGKGSFEETLQVIGIGLYVPLYIMALIDLLIAIYILPGYLFKPNLILGNLYTIIPTIWSIITTIIASKEVQKLSWLKSIFITIIALLPVAALSFVFIR